jgi:hypothetical protein
MISALAVPPKPGMKPKTNKPALARMKTTR